MRTIHREVGQTWSFRGSKSRNKVTVGEPAVGSLVYSGRKVACNAFSYWLRPYTFCELLATLAGCICAGQLFYLVCDCLSKILILTTFDNGSLGSRNDEERSEMRYVMWIAELVNHRIFERILRFMVFRKACLFENHFNLHPWWTWAFTLQSAWP